jgi:hypothetical protein
MKLKNGNKRKVQCHALDIWLSEGCLKFDQAPSGTMEFDCLAKGGGVRSQLRIGKMLRELQMTVRCKLVIDSVDLQPSSVGSSTDIIQRPILQVYFYFSFHFYSHF